MTNGIHRSLIPPVLRLAVFRGEVLLWEGRWQPGSPTEGLGVHVEHELSGRGHWVDLAPYCRLQLVAIEAQGLEAGPGLEQRYPHRLLNVVEKFGEAVELEDVLTVCVSWEPAGGPT